MWVCVCVSMCGQRVGGVNRSMSIQCIDSIECIGAEH